MSIFLQTLHGVLAVPPSPHPSPKKFTSRKRNIFAFRQVIPLNPCGKEPFMKRTTQKKIKTFRTLIRRTPICSKTVRDDSNMAAVRRKSEKQETHPPFFFGQ
jgi:hypothetical protein